MLDPLIIDGSPHVRGSKSCGYCWPNFPEPCKCGGLIHASFGDENDDCEYWLYYRCDKCDSTERPE